MSLMRLCGCDAATARNVHCVSPRNNLAIDSLLGPKCEGKYRVFYVTDASETNLRSGK